MHCNHNFIPQAFLQKITCSYLDFNTYKESLVIFTLDNLLPNSFTVDNEHGNVVVNAGQTTQKADAHVIAGYKRDISQLSQQYLAIKTADCLPIVFVYEDETLFIGGVTHAGWRGLTSGIIHNTIDKLKDHAISFKLDMNLFLKGLKVFIGPAIFGVSYECGDNVKEAIRKYKQLLFGHNKATQREFELLFDICANVKNDPSLDVEIKNFAHKYEISLQNQTIFPDLQLLATLECVSFGIQQENVAIFRENTYGHAILSSFRESSHKKKGLTRRLWTHLNLKY